MSHCQAHFIHHQYTAVQRVLIFLIYVIFDLGELKKWQTCVKCGQATALDWKCQVSTISFIMGWLWPQISVTRTMNGTYSQNICSYWLLGSNKSKRTCIPWMRIGTILFVCQIFMFWTILAPVTQFMDKYCPIALHCGQIQASRLTFSCDFSFSPSLL